MALVKCVECAHLVSNKAIMCPHCGYAPKGSCRSCQWFAGAGSFCNGRCYAVDDENEFVKEYKGVCPGVIKKNIFGI